MAALDLCKAAHGQVSQYRGFEIPASCLGLVARIGVHADPDAGRCRRLRCGIQTLAICLHVGVAQRDPFAYPPKQGHCRGGIGARAAIRRGNAAGPQWLELDSNAGRRQREARDKCRHRLEKHHAGGGRSRPATGCRAARRTRRCAGTWSPPSWRRRPRCTGAATGDRHVKLQRLDRRQIYPHALAFQDTHEANAPGGRDNRCIVCRAGGRKIIAIAATARGHGV